MVTVSGRWQGLVGGGAGRLRSRRARVRVSGRGAAHRERVASLLLPGPSGAVAEADWPIREMSTRGERSMEALSSAAEREAG
jgi:hypothetical protein